MAVALIPSAAHDLATDAAIIPAIAPRRQLHRGVSVEIDMEQRTAAIKFGGWSEFGVGSAPERRMRTLIQVNAWCRQINEAYLPCGKLRPG
jgi:hypothetical protein